ncbi:hypothetical protein LSH36_224g02007 [Paralvinella palmiformis]|uniref:Transglutaminase-like domain-containing protein n=1 Tax=Paralvinella palmiformis TaxID=53620 RepID=A0AAD9JNI3_9ANNE|nr:hypothetical protein LSH36_224g02007 [Paralvinella palmiformis]
MNATGRRYDSTSFDFRISYPSHWSTEEYDLPVHKQYDDEDETEMKPAKVTSPLKVKSLDLNAAGNARNHQTDMYQMTDESKDVNGDIVPAQLVVRRGKEFTMTLTFDREFGSDDQIRLVLQLGDRPLVSKGTSVQVSPEYMLRSRHWSCSLQSTKGDKITLAVLSPPTCYVGRWKLVVETWLKKEAKNKVDVLKYTHQHPVYIIFNPFCKDDQVYMGDEVDVDEYVLNDSGKIFTGAASQPTYKPWNFSQFESPLLECCMELLELSHLNIQSRGDPVGVVRKISTIVNSADDNGVLTGNWSGNYNDGTAPSHWTGSAPILKQYFQTKKPVCYGQCWVFSGVSTTVCRALVYRCSTTNFASAHDCDGSITIDNYWDTSGTPLKEYNEDSVWNFHVWNEAWMSRPDLDPGCGGWQVFDATPQETSGGVYCAGPVSVEAIRNGNVNLPYDGRFVFAEVNSDKVHWVLQENGDWRKIIEKNVVGQKISTKQPRKSTMSFWKSYMHKDEKERMDLTGAYKYPEGTEAERAVVLRANLYSTRPDIYDHGEEDVKFELRQKDDVMVGNTFDVTLRAQNTSRKLRHVHAVVTLKSAYYTGVVHKSVVKRQHFDFEVPGIRAEEVVMRVSFEEYQHVIVDQIGFIIDVLATVSETNQLTPLQDTYRLRRPDLTIQAPDTVRVGETFDVVIKFESTMPIHLTQCQWMVDGPGLGETIKKTHKELEPYDSAELKLSFVARKPGERTIVAGFDSKELRDVSGSQLVRVEE